MRGRVGHLVGAAVEQPRAGDLRHRPVAAVVLVRRQRRRDELVLAALDVVAQVHDPLLLGELGDPDHVGLVDVAVRRLGLEALDRLLALLVGSVRELDELGLQALVLVALVEAVDGAVVAAAVVLAGAERDGAGRVLGLRRARAPPSRPACSPSPRPPVRSSRRPRRRRGPAPPPRAVPPVPASSIQPSSPLSSPLPGRGTAFIWGTPMTFTTRPVLRGTFGMVAATHWLAAASGMRMLELGGNAFDAAAAAGFVLQVVEPHQNGPGGDLPRGVLATGRRAAGAVRAGPGAGRRLGRSPELDLIPGDGLLPAVVPGAFDGWMQLVRDFGTLRLRDVLEPAIGYARRASRSWPSWRRRRRARMPSASGPSGRRRPRCGCAAAARGRASCTRCRAWPATYRRILAEAPGGSREAEFDAARDAFYRGFVADAVDRFSAARRRPAARDDLSARWSATYEEPVTFGYRGLTVCKPGPGARVRCSSSSSRCWTASSWAAWLAGRARPHDRRVLEARVRRSRGVVRRPRRRRAARRRCCRRSYNDERRALVGAGRVARAAARGARTGAPRCWSTGRGADGRVERAGRQRHLRRGRRRPVRERGRRRRRAAAGSRARRRSPSSASAWARAGRCSGPTSGIRRGIAPGKRPRTTLSPTLALRDGEPYLGVRDAGRRRAGPVVAAVLSGARPAGSTCRRRWTRRSSPATTSPSSFYPRAARPGAVDAEAAFGEAVIGALRERGHDVAVVPDWSLSRLVAAGRSPSGLLTAAADARGMMRYAAGR